MGADMATGEDRPPRVAPGPAEEDPVRPRFGRKSATAEDESDGLARIGGRGGYPALGRPLGACVRIATAPRGRLARQKPRQGRPGQGPDLAVLEEGHRRTEDEIHVAFDGAAPVELAEGKGGFILAEAVLPGSKSAFFGKEQVGVGVEGDSLANEPFVACGIEDRQAADRHARSRASNPSRPSNPSRASNAQRATGSRPAATELKIAYIGGGSRG